MLTQDTTHLIQRPCYQLGNPCGDPAGNWTTRRPGHRKEKQTASVQSCLPLIRSGQNHLARHTERGKKTRLTKEEVGRQHQGTDRPGVRQVQEGSGKKGKMEETGCEIICGAPTILTVKGLRRRRRRRRRFQHVKKKRECFLLTFPLCPRHRQLIPKPLCKNKRKLRHS